MTPTRGMDQERNERRLLRLEAAADIRPRTGPCLACGTYQPVLFRGRRGGANVYCQICAIGTRTDSQKGLER
jgi:hypothetical protein